MLYVYSPCATSFSLNKMLEKATKKYSLLALLWVYIISVVIYISKFHMHTFVIRLLQDSAAILPTLTRGLMKGKTRVSTHKAQVRADI